MLAPFPEIRRVWARYYDTITQIDYHVGRHLRELQEDGVDDDTIVVFWADHGTGMLRAKHWLWEQGDHVPLIVRYPARSVVTGSSTTVPGRLARSGQLRGAQRQIAAKRKPFEELYDGATDPYFVTDLAREERHQQSLTEMREQLYGWMIEHLDLGLIDEPELHERADGAPLWEVGRQLDNYERILETSRP